MGLISWLTGRRASGEVDIASPAFKADPFSYYAKLRTESPVHRITLPDGQTAWLITRYDDVVAALKDDRLAKDRTKALTPGQLKKQPWAPAAFKPLLHNMLDQDPPDHTRLRSLVQKAFTPRLVEGMRPRIESLTHELLDAVQSRRQFDLIGDYALPVPTTIIAEMLGVPVADRYKFARWSNAIVSSTSSKWGTILAIPAVVRFLRFIRRLIRERRERPQADLITALVQAEDEGQTLNEDETLAMIFLLLVAGHETTVNLIGNGMLALMQHPEQYARLKEDPTLIRSAVEEMLRYTSPVETATERYAREEFTIAGTTIPQGSLVVAALASANRDPSQFPNPDTFDIAREPNRHVAFGLGPHFCLGASLARLEGQIAIATLMQRLPMLRLAVDATKLRWRRGLFLRGMYALPVTVASS